MWNARLESLSARASATVKTQFHKELEEWRTAGNVALARLTELHAASGESWDEIKLEMEKIWHAIEAALAAPEKEERPMPDQTIAAQPKPVA